MTAPKPKMGARLEIIAHSLWRQDTTNLYRSWNDLPEWKQDNYRKIAIALYTDKK